MIQDLAYALVQVIHNLGAVAVVGSAVFALSRSGRDPVLRQRLAWVVLVGWATQIASGATFGAISIYFYGHPPDIHAIAMVALFVKMGCAATGFVVAALCLHPATRDLPLLHNRAWPVLAALGVTAISSAAFLRWFS